MNVLWIVVDCLRYDALSAHGYYRDTTSNLDPIFRSDFVRFEDACTQSAFTLTSATSMLTGTYPAVHGALTFGDSIPAEVNKWCDYVRRANRTCDAIAGMNFFREGWGLGETVSRVHDLDQYKQRRAHEQAYADEIVETFQQQVLENDEPFVSMLWFFDAHTPWASDTVFAGLNTKRDSYDTEVQFIDRQLERLFVKLKEMSLYDETLIIFTSDHGDIFGDHYRLEGTSIADIIMKYEVPKLRSVLTGDGYIGHLSRPLYEELLHVPLYLKFPYQEYANVTVGEQVELVDLLPTVIDVLDIDVPQEERHWQGRSLQPIVTGDAEGHQFAFAEMIANETGGRSLAVRGSDYKLLRMEEPPRSLRLLRDDPLTYLTRRYLTPGQKLLRRDDESTDLSNTHPERARQMADRLDEWMDDTKRYLDSTSPTRSSLTEERRQELENLGYL